MRPFRAPDVSRETLFADAEITKQPVQNLFDIDSPGCPADPVRGPAQILGNHFQRPNPVAMRIGKRGERNLQAASLLWLPGQRIPMPLMLTAR